jgi:hypothetical protein
VSSYSNTRRAISTNATFVDLVSSIHWEHLHASLQERSRVTDNNNQRPLTAMMLTSQASDVVLDVSLDSVSAPSLLSVDSENDLIASRPRLGTLLLKYPAHLQEWHWLRPRPHGFTVRPYRALCANSFVTLTLVAERRRSLSRRASSNLSRRMAGHTIGTGRAVVYSLTRSPIFFLNLYT